ncbi:MAG: asparaginase [Thermotaleaceae bacterium]
MEPLAVVTRNDYIESIHYGYICITNGAGKVLYELGNSNVSIFFRSSAKPIQVIPLLLSGAAQAFDFSLQEIALACASHSGQSIHQKTAQEILNRLHLNPNHLHCGIMFPYNPEESKRLIQNNEEPTVLHCSCSGKHAAMLALAAYQQLPIETYESLEHPVQQQILQAIANFAEMNPADIPVGIDGCGVPIYLLPIKKIALSYANLINAAKDINHTCYHAANIVVSAMQTYPEMVSGEGEFCTELMKHTHQKLIGKVGSEAVYCMGIKEQDLGICIKIVDGSERAVYPVVLHLLKQLCILTEDEEKMLQPWLSSPLKNNLNEVIGSIIPVFNIQQPQNSPVLIGKHIKDIL